jgi:hypothetical protein
VRPWLALLLAACAAPAAVPGPAPLPELPALPAGPAGFQLRQALRFEYPGGSGSLEVIVQSRCGELAIVGLAPFGSRAFTLIQRGSRLESELHLPGAWPFPPENIARDVHRALLVPLPAQPPPGGERELRYGGERVRERWGQGQLRERWLIPDGAAEPGGVRIEYRDGATREHLSQDFRLENRALGYALEITTSESRGLSCPAESG